MFDIIPGILEKDFFEIGKKIELAKNFAKTIHIDIIDGKFAPNTTFLNPKPFEKYSRDVLLEAHFMVEEPINYLESFAASGFKRFLGHIEKMTSQEEFVVRAEFLGEVGLALDLDTPLESLKAGFEDLDYLLIMGVKAGFSGQSFNPSVLEKVKKIRENSPVPVEVDGGINEATFTQGLSCGVNRFVTTSFLFNGDFTKNYQKLTALISTANE